MANFRMQPHCIFAYVDDIASGWCNVYVDDTMRVPDYGIVWDTREDADEHFTVTNSQHCAAYRIRIKLKPPEAYSGGGGRS